MRFPHLRLAAMLRSRSAALAVGAAVLVTVVVANQPRDEVSHPRSAAAASTVRAGNAAPSPPLRTMQRRVEFGDASASHGGAPAVAADSGILVDLDTRSIIWERNPHLSHAPASTTKIVSTLVALVNFAPDRQVTITADALHQAGDETVMGIHAGETYTIADLLAGMLLISGNDAATALAVDTVGMDRFVNAMNAQMAALGLHDSHFTTPVGLDDAAQLSSAYDLAAAATVAQEVFPQFRQLVSTIDMQLPATPGHPGFALHNLNRLLSLYPPTVGIKPGYTGNAGPCLVAEAVREGHHILGVLLGAPHLYSDMRMLIDWGFTQRGLRPMVTPPPAPPPPPPARRPHR
jgi:serine-type D-Ala-D-Ala carboxypeptidase (penicillin-binding protein 5/6)